MEYKRSTMRDVAGFQPGGSKSGSRVKASGLFTRIPMRTPYATKQIAAAHPRRSIFASQREVFRSRGMDKAEVETFPACLMRRRRLIIIPYIGELGPAA